MISQSIKDQLSLDKNRIEKSNKLTQDIKNSSIQALKDTNQMQSTFYSWWYWIYDSIIYNFFSEKDDHLLSKCKITNIKKDNLYKNQPNKSINESNKQNEISKKLDLLKENSLLIKESIGEQNVLIDSIGENISTSNQKLKTTTKKIN